MNLEESMNLPEVYEQVRELVDDPTVQTFLENWFTAAHAAAALGRQEGQNVMFMVSEALGNDDDGTAYNGYTVRVRFPDDHIGIFLIVNNARINDFRVIGDEAVIADQLH